MRLAVLVPPDLHQSAGLVRRDLLRESVLTMAQHRLTTAADAGAATWIDVGARGEVATKVVQRALAWVPDRIELWVPATHVRTARRLADAFAAAARPVLTEVVARSEEARPLGPEEVVVPLHPDSRWLKELAPSAVWCLPAVAPAVVAEGVPSPFSPALHHGDGCWLAELTEWVAMHRPYGLPDWRCLLHAHAAHTEPIAAIYAGLHLRERNADLLMNIL